MIKSFLREDFRKYASNEVFDKIVDLKTILEFLKHIKEYDKLNAIQRKDGTVATFAEFYTDILKICYALKEMNIEKNTNVGVYCHNNYEFACTALGVMAYRMCSYINTFSVG